MIGMIRLLPVVFLVPWLVPTSASGQSVVYVVNAAAKCGQPDLPGRSCSRAGALLGHDGVALDASNDNVLTPPAVCLN